MSDLLTRAKLPLKGIRMRILILETSEGRKPANEGPADEPIVKTAFEVPPSEIPPSTEIDAIEPTTIRDAPAKITRGEAAALRFSLSQPQFLQVIIEIF